MDPARPTGGSLAEPELPDELSDQLSAVGILDFSEVALRCLLESQVSAYTVYRLPPAAVRKWKAHYRIMLGATYLDCQSVREAYARAYLAALAANK